MSPRPATAEQIADYEAIVATAWGGQNTLDKLFAETAHYKWAFLDAVYGRYQGALEIITPWVLQRYPEIGTKRLFEIGCGTGSSTAAFATICESISGYDIDEGSVRMAEARLKTFGVDNASVTTATFSEILLALDREQRVDGVLLFAVLEHMYVSERIELLNRAWQKIPPGGIIVVGETPNRLSYIDGHTFRQPFAHMLPPELSKMWASHCVDDTTRKALVNAPKDYMGMREALTRMGFNGPSFHEFELAIGPDVHTKAISKATDIPHEEYDLERELLSSYLRKRLPHVHEVFSMPVFYFILRK